MTALGRDVPPYSFEEGRPARHPFLVYIFAFNEGKRFTAQLQKFPGPEARNFDLIIGDDGTTDGSTDSSIIKTFGLRGITRLDKNRGLSSVIKSGMDWVLKQQYQGVILMNGNGRDGVDAIASFLNKLEEGFGYVQGSRFHPEGRHANTPFIRHAAIRLIHAPLFSLACGRWMTDTTNGFRAFSTEALNAMGDGLFSPRFQKYEVEQYMAWKTIRLGYSSTEIPVSREYAAVVPKGISDSKIKPGIGWWEMIKPLLCLLTRSYP